ncbi:MAG: aminoacyl-tRNA hydrolase [Actinobacteria bacterium HGW-Actinobacteria-2]|nr:MAG: aminoacyl-tRNA hydrolase [Actinobacteria bacterium HGW-Actinobacteria-2]
MFDVRIAPGPGVPDGLVISAAELTERYSHASGPGGQGVNTADSRVQLSLDLATTTALSDVQRARALRNLATRLDGTVLTIDAAQHRSQRRNRTEARERLAGLLRDALAPPPPPRRATRPSRAAVERRLVSKHRRGQLKRSRQSTSD